MSVKRVYVGDYPVDVPDLGRTVNPGDEVEFAEDPNHGLFVTPAEAKKHAKSSEED